MTKAKLTEEEKLEAWVTKHPDLAEFAKQMGTRLALQEKEIEGLMTELDKVITLMATIVRLNGACKMLQDDILATYEMTHGGKGHLAMISGAGGEIRAVWKIGSAPKSPVEPLPKRED